MSDSHRSAPSLPARVVEQRSRLFLRHQIQLRGYLRALLRNGHDAEDLLQEVGVKVLTHPDTPLDPVHFPRWCRAVARHLWLHHVRARRRSPLEFVDPLSDIIDRAYDEADDGGDPEARRRALSDCLSELNDRSQRLLRMRYAEERSSEEIGKDLGKSPTATRMMLLRLREIVARCIQRRLDTAKGHA